jgi:hypothetical protein
MKKRKRLCDFAKILENTKIKRNKSLEQKKNLKRQLKRRLRILLNDCREVENLIKKHDDQLNVCDQDLEKLKEAECNFQATALCDSVTKQKLCCAPFCNCTATVYGECSHGFCVHHSNYPFAPDHKKKICKIPVCPNCRKSWWKIDEESTQPHEFGRHIVKKIVGDQRFRILEDILWTPRTDFIHEEHPSYLMFF